MKKFVLSILTFAALATVLSCSKEQQNSDNVSGESKDVIENQDIILFTASIDASTKTAVDLGTHKVTWNAGDEIGIYDGVSIKQYRILATDAGKSAVTFEPVSESVQNAATYFAKYPYRAGDSFSTESNTFVTVFPADQTLVGEGTVDASAMICSASSSTTELDFHNAYSLVQFTLSDSDVKEVIVEGLCSAGRSATLAGAFTVSCDVTPSLVKAATALTTSVSLKPSASVFAAGTYAVVLPPVQFADGFRIVSRHSSDCKVATKAKASSVTLPRNGGVNLGSLSFAQYDKYYIRSLADMQLWANNYSNWSSSDKVLVGADIDCGGAAPVLNAAGANTFTGTFDGQYHGIYKISVTNKTTAYTCLFNEVTGTVRNFYFGTVDGINTDAVSTLVGAAPTGTTYTGVIGKLSGKAENIKVFSKGDGKNCIRSAGTITDTEHLSYTAALAAYAQSGAEIVNCDIHTKVTNGASTSATITSFSYLGGVVGYAETNVKVSGCKLTATGVNPGPDGVYVKSTYPYCIYLGGVAGGMSSDATVKDCNVAAEVSLDDSKGLAMIGGIIGNYAAASDKQCLISGCTNSGSIALKLNAVVSGSYHNVGGIVGGCVGDTAVTKLPGTDAGYNLVLDSCTSSAVLTLGQYSVTYSGGFCGNIKNCAIKLKDSSFSGSIDSSGSHKTDNNRIGGLIGMSDRTTSSFYVKDCSNIGSISVQANSYAGGLLGTGSTAGSNIDGFYTTSATTISTAGSFKAVGMISGTASNVYKVTSAKVAGKIVAGETTTVLDASNFSSKLDGGSKAIDFTNVSFNSDDTVK